MKIAVFSTQNYDEAYLQRHATNDLEFTFYEAGLNKDTASLAANHQGICVFVNDVVDRPCIEVLAEQGVKIIALRCAGFNNVDMEAAKEKGIKVTRVPAYSPQAVAEHTLALILTLNRKTHKAYNRVREANFSLSKLEGFNIYKKTVGVIGTGKIGQAFCEIMLGFGVKILAYDPFPSTELEAKGVLYAELDELFRESDIISLHCPLRPETYHILDEKAFAKMKDGVMVINTSRGGLINTPDVIKALKSQKLGYLGIDVYEQEKDLFFRDLSENIIQDEVFLRLLSFPNVIITAHQAFFTEEALTEIALTTIQNLEQFRQGVDLVNEVV